MSTRRKHVSESEENQDVETPPAKNVIVLSATPEQLNALVANIKFNGAHITKSPGDVPAVIAFQSYGVLCDGKYDEDLEQLTVTVVNKPFFVTYEMVSAGIREILEQ